ncbi:hypothetical protein DRE_01135 [Drechslerella stenobrocha 248]|uniref:Uncharacterized protein n=1 Tax=Drechslerella stenobrocha 248 TaxID=1043628 RepID=W7HMG8_9PEZI|nr:hypothetical protein DRE_01135 [Drechslerella stenobrocha 248]
MACVAAQLNPFYMVVKVPQYSSLPPHNLIQTTGYLVVPKSSQTSATGVQSKYFFLMQLQDIDFTTLSTSKFWYDMETTKVYSETVVVIPAPGGEMLGGPGGGGGNQVGSGAASLTSLEAEIQAAAGDAGAGVSPVTSIEEFADAELGDAGAGPGNNLLQVQTVLDLDSVVLDDEVTQLWELFGDMSAPSGALRAAYLEESSSSVQDLVQGLYGGNIGLRWRRLWGFGAVEADNQLWLWRCILPLGEQFKTRFPAMDPTESAAFFNKLVYLLIVRPKYADPDAELPANHDSWDFDGQSCYRIQPWRGVLSVPAGELEMNLHTVKQGVLPGGSTSLQILDNGNLFAQSGVNSGADSGAEGGGINMIAPQLMSPEVVSQGDSIQFSQLGNAQFLSQQGSPLEPAYGSQQSPSEASEQSASQEWTQQMSVPDKPGSDSSNSSPGFASESPP